MANILRGGFHPVDSARFKPRRFTVASAYAPANSLPGIARGEVVTLVTAGTLEVSAAGAAALILGVVADVRYIAADGSVVYGGYLPTGYTYSGEANIANPLAPVISVWVDPDIEYIACVAAGTTSALAYAGVGANMDLSATSATTMSTTHKESLRTLDGTFVAGTAQMRINDLVRDPLNDVTSANYRVRCQINEGIHQYFSGAGI